MKKEIKVILFGASKACENYLKYIQNNDEYKNFKVLAIADNNKAKINGFFEGYKIILPAEIKEYTPDKIIITSTYLSEIYNQLTNELDLNPDIISQAPKNSIIEYKNKGVFENEDIRNKAEEILRFLIELFNKEDIKYFIDHGTLLGLVREQRIMPWDDDIDITLLKESYLKVSKIVKKNNREIEKILNCKVKIEESKIKNNTKDIKIKVFENKSFLYDITIKTVSFIDNEAYQNITKSPDIHFLKNDILNLWDLKIKVPYKPEDYLTVHYGDWKTPKKNTSFLDLKNYVEAVNEEI